MTPGSFRFDRFCLDAHDRRLTRDDAPVELNARYLDALILLVSEQGKLVSKDRFLDEVWRGVPVTDEALTQCIRTIRRQLGDDAVRPRFIETAPKHGYRFIAAVTPVNPQAEPTATIPEITSAQSLADTASDHVWRRFFLIGAAGAGGGGVAGVLGGLFYGLGGTSSMGSASVVLVLVAIAALLAVVGGAGVGFGVAAAGFVPGRSWVWTLVGGAAGGLFVGAVVKLLGLDAFNLLFGQAPGEMTGALEGALLGGAVGFAAWLAGRPAMSVSFSGRIAAAGLIGGAVGVLIPLLGGRLMGGSLDLLARRFPDSRLRLDQIGHLFGEASFGPFSQIVTSGLEAALFCACVVGAMILAQRRLARPTDRQDAATSGSCACAALENSRAEVSHRTT